MSKSQTKRVFVAMSGGVDSSVAALLLKKAGYCVTGVFMRCWTSSNTQNNAELRAEQRGNDCGWERDATDARRAAEKLGIPFYVWDFEKEYKKRVVDYMIEGYRWGITPNPDVMCNREIKFGLFFERARAAGADYVATGHYVRRLSFSETGVASAPAASARLHLGAATPRGARNVQARHTSDNSPEKKTASSFGLGVAKDENKDQSYFLWTLTQEKLRHCLFPIGDYLKSEVREMAREAGLPTAEKKDSQGICFLGKIALGDFLRGYIPEKRGEVLAMSEVEGLKIYKKIGEHAGTHFYTIGQRHIGIANRQSQMANNRPVYVAEKDACANALVVAEGSDNPALYKKEIDLADASFIDPEYRSPTRANRRTIQVFARARYRQNLVPAELTIHASPKQSKLAAEQVCFTLHFDQPIKFVAPGQSAVMYSHDSEVVGGGVIAAAR